LAYVASGRYEGFFDYDTVPHDIAAGILLAKEAGGMVSTPDGRFPSLEGGNDLIVGNPTIHGLLKLLFPSPAAKKQEATPSEQSSHGS
jgi:myo-inositol-1(or 4)-monophosphatase